MARLSPLPPPRTMTVSAPPGVLDLSRIEKEADLAAALARLRDLTLDEARLLYRKLHRRTAPPSFGADLLVRACAYRMQETLRGGLSDEVRGLLDRMARAKAPPPRWIRPGSTLVRSWRGQTYEVTVTAVGFAWNGTTYTSLSELARTITGTSWNGPRFFGLRGPGKDGVAERTTTSRPRGRPRKMDAPTKVTSAASHAGEAHHG